MSQAEKDSRQGHGAARPPSGPPSLQFQGWRLNVVLTASMIGLFLSFLDTTIVAVALTTIADQFDEFDRSTWVITAYLLTYMAFGIIISRFSDIFGKKGVHIACFVLFFLFSLGCALSRTMMQLIIFRAFQGVGGSGLFTMTMVTALNAIPPERMGILTAFIATTQTTSGILGPVLGGAITHDQTSPDWRWIFYANLPLCAAAVVGLIVAWPTDKSKRTFTRAAFASIDVAGCILLLAAAVLLVFALQEGGTYAYPWRSGAIVVSFVLSGVCLASFISWQLWLAARPSWPVKPVFPMAMLKYRTMSAAFLVTILSGFTYYLAVVNLPERFQIVGRDNPLIAGVRLLPMLASGALGSFVGGASNQKRNNTAYLIIAASALQLLGYGLMITLGEKSASPPRNYGFQVLLGFGFGLSISSTTIGTQLLFLTQPKYTAVAQGALTQMRTLGGSIGLASGVIIFNQRIKASTALTETLSGSQLASLYKSPLSIARLTPQQQALVATVYADAFTRQMVVATGISAAAFIVSYFVWTRNPAPTRRQQAAAGRTNAATEVTHQPNLAEVNAHRHTNSASSDMIKLTDLDVADSSASHDTATDKV